MFPFYVFNFLHFHYFEGLVAPKDGLRRLLQMEKTSGIWTQKMQMKLDKNWVLILDYENGVIYFTSNIQLIILYI